jgi:hypothetical protein
MFLKFNFNLNRKGDDETMEMWVSMFIALIAQKSGATGCLGIIVKVMCQSYRFVYKAT